MAEKLEVQVNREHPNSLEVPGTFETTRDFVIVIENAGKPVHLHVNIDDDLHGGLSLETGNHYIPRESSYQLPVQVDQSARPFMGKCRFSVAYGSETRYSEVRITEPETPERVTVDESLAEPPQQPVRPTVEERILSETALLAVLFVGFLGLIAGGVLLAIVTTPLAGISLVIIGLLVAIGIYLVISNT